MEESVGMADPLRSVINPAMLRLLRSPLHRTMSGNILLITFTGRKTGRRYTTPLSYLQEGDTVYCLTDARWSENLVGGAIVTLRLRGEDVQGTARAYRNEPARVAAVMMRFFERVPRDAKFYGVRLDASGKPDYADVQRAASGIILIEVSLG